MLNNTDCFWGLFLEFVVEGSGSVSRWSVSRVRESGRRRLAWLLTPSWGQRAPSWGQPSWGQPSWRQASWRQASWLPSSSRQWPFVGEQAWRASSRSNVKQQSPSSHPFSFLSCPRLAVEALCRARLLPASHLGGLCLLGGGLLGSSGLLGSRLLLQGERRRGGCGGRAGVAGTVLAGLASPLAAALLPGRPSWSVLTLTTFLGFLGSFCVPQAGSRQHSC